MRDSIILSNLKSIGYPAKTSPRINMTTTFTRLTHTEALVESAGGAFFPGNNGDWTARASKAHIILSILDGAFEKSLARLAREYSIMKTTDLVAANWTRGIY